MNQDQIKHAELLREAETATAKVIRVDDFPAKARSAAADQAA